MFSSSFIFICCFLGLRKRLIQSYHCIPCSVFIYLYLLTRHMVGSFEVNGLNLCLQYTIVFFVLLCNVKTQVILKQKSKQSRNQQWLYSVFNLITSCLPLFSTLSLTETNNLLLHNLMV